MTKEEKIARYSKLNQEVVPGKIAMANKAVQELAERHHAKYIDINDPLKDRDGNLKAEYTIEGMHIKEEKATVRSLICLWGMQKSHDGTSEI